MWQPKPATREDIDRLSNLVIGASIEVHRELGPGLLESVYEASLLHELKLRGVAALSQVHLPLNYKGLVLDQGYRVDVVVEDCLIVEVKAIDRLLPVHEAQVLSYLRLSGVRLGLLINFNVPILREGLKRIVLNF
ncbi:MAG: GxxExxY protein [Phycisphaerales bacterium]|nr:GxxExxY protein [Phycisphaerales bacterium]